MSARRLFYVSWTFLCLTLGGAAAEEPRHDAVRPVPRTDAWWQNRHGSFNERVAQGNVDLIFLGDSITQAWESDGKATWDKHFAPRNAVNLGISGDRTQHVLWRLEHGNIAGIKPKLAVIMIGTNNAGANTSEEIADGVTAIVKTLRRELPATKILLLAIFPRGADNNDGARKVNQGANAMLAKLSDGNAIVFLDLAPKFVDADGVLPKEIMPDLLHLSPKGYALWAEGIEAEVARLME